MSGLKENIINHIIEVEGGYVNDPNDSGGETNFGVTVEVARNNGYAGNMEDMPREFAFDVYAEKYWSAVRGDDLEKVDSTIAAEVVDTAVNMGPRRAGKFLQRALNAFNIVGTLYDDLVIDGEIGPATIRALNAYKKQREINPLLKALNCLQGAFYVELAERREKDEKFIYGWFRNRIGV